MAKSKAKEIQFAPHVPPEPETSLDDYIRDRSAGAELIIEDPATLNAFATPTTTAPMSGSVSNRELSRVIDPDKLGIERLSISEADNYGAPDATIQVFRNPTEYEESVETDWARFSPQGSSYSNVQFVSTKNHTIDMELHWFSPADVAERHSQGDRARRLLLGWCYPRETADGWSLGPPKLKVMWMNSFIQNEFTAYLVECKLRVLQFSNEGYVLRWGASVKFEEIASFDEEPSVRALGRLNDAVKRMPLSIQSARPLNKQPQAYIDASRLPKGNRS